MAVPGGRGGGETAAADVLPRAAGCAAGCTIRGTTGRTTSGEIRIGPGQRGELSGAHRVSGGDDAQEAFRTYEAA